MLYHSTESIKTWMTACILFSVAGFRELAIVVHPVDQNATVGETVQFNCSTDRDLERKDAIEWKHRRSGGNSSTERKFVYESGAVDKTYDKRYTVKVISGAYNLIIKEIISEDAGEFMCKEKDISDNSPEAKKATLLVNDRKSQDLSTTEGNVYPSRDIHPMQDTTISEVSGESTVAPMNDPSTSDDNNIAAIVAPIVIVFVVVVVIIIVVYVIKRRRSKRQNTSENQGHEMKSLKNDQ